MTPSSPVLVLGGTGTVGSRVAALLRDSGHDVRVAARHAEHRFDWAEPDTWGAALSGVHRMFVLLPEQTGIPDGFLATALRAGVRRVVLHSDRGADLMGVTHLQEAEQGVRDSGCDWTIVRPDWFHQNFETFLRQSVIDGRVCMPVGDARQGFVDACDIAAVEVAALVGGELTGQVVEVTGPRALSFAEAVEEISRATGHRIDFDGTADAYREAMRTGGLPDEVIEMLIGNFGRLQARGDSEPTGAVERILGRPGRDFADYAVDAAARGVWAPAAQ